MNAKKTIEISTDNCIHICEKMVELAVMETISYGNACVECTLCDIGNIGTNIRSICHKRTCSCYLAELYIARCKSGE